MTSAEALVEVLNEARGHLLQALASAIHQWTAADKDERDALKSQLDEIEAALDRVRDAVFLLDGLSSQPMLPMD